MVEAWLVVGVGDGQSERVIEERMMGCMGEGIEFFFARKGLGRQLWHRAVVRQQWVPGGGYVTGSVQLLFHKKHRNNNVTVRVFGNTIRVESPTF